MSGWFGVRPPLDAVDRIARGAPEIPIPDLGAPPGLDAGRPVRLLDDAGGVLGAGVADPENGVVRILAREAIPALDAAFFRDRVTRAAALRAALGLTGGESAFRIVNAEGDGLSGFTVDVYGPYAVAGVLAKGLVPLARLLAEALLAFPDLHLRGVVLKVYGKDAADRSGKEEILGETPPEKHVAREAGVPYEVHLLKSRNTGLFTDLREARRSLPPYVAGKRVLNTFAYTGAFSVTAARAGAAAVTTVDLSAGVLNWARENFRLSGLDPADPRFAFEASDVRRFLEKCRKERREFDVILVDPPTVSAARSAAWTMKRDYPDLIAEAIACLPATGGLLQLSANARGGADVARHFAAGLRKARREGAILETGGLPADYPTPPEWPSARYLELVRAWVHPA